MSFLEALLPFTLFLALVAYLRANGYYAEEVVAAPAPLCACNGVCVAPEVLVTSEEPPSAVPATPARAPPPATPATPLTAVRRPLTAASPSPRTPRVWRNTCTTDQESVDSLLRWMSQKFLEGADEEEDP